MKLLTVAVAARPPGWVVEGWNEYARRMPRELPLELIEVQSGSYLGEDDIVRFGDRYGRMEEKA